MKKDIARQRVRDAVRSGRLVKPDKCSRCLIVFEKKLIHGHHHRGYENPYEIEWICIFCHNKEHIELLRSSSLENSKVHGFKKGFDPRRNITTGRSKFRPPASL